MLVAPSACGLAIGRSQQSWGGGGHLCPTSIWQATGHAVRQDRQCAGQLGPGALLATFGLHHLRRDVAAGAGDVPCYGLALRLNAEAGSALPQCADAQVDDEVCSEDGAGETGGPPRRLSEKNASA